MAEYDGAITAASRSDGSKLNTALSKVHPELDQRGTAKDQGADPQAIAHLADAAEKHTDDFGLEPDHALQAFNAFLERDNVEHPEHRHGATMSTINQVKALTHGVFAYDDDEIVSPD